MSVFVPIRKKGNAKECSNYHTIALISHGSKVMLNILQARFQQYVNCELPGVQPGFRKDRGNRDHIANILWIIEKAREFQKNIYFCFIDCAKAFDWGRKWQPTPVLLPGESHGQRSVVGYSPWGHKESDTTEHTAQAFDCVDHNKLWKILKEMGTPGHLTYLLRNLYAGQEATVRTGHGITDWFQIRKGVHQGCILSPCLFNLYADYIMRNAGLEEAQAGIKITRRNINNLRYADDTTFMAESDEEL